MRYDEYAKRDGLGLAALVRSGEVTAAEVVEAAIGRAEAVNGRINAIVHKAWDDARKAAAAPCPTDPSRACPS